MKDTIVQFVLFSTKMGPDQFIAEWEPYAKKLQGRIHEPHLLELVATEAKNKYRYISLHKWSDGDFNFSFRKKSRTESIPEHDVQVVQAGGYIAHSSKKRYTEEDSDVKLIAFVGHNDTDIEFYRCLNLARNLVIYEAYYENCTYGYILEFSVREVHAGELLSLLEKRPGVSAAIYKECAVTA